MNAELLTLSRLQFAFTVAFHMTFPAITVGLSVFLVLMYGTYLRTNKEIYLTIYRFWRNIFAVGFGLGVVAGIVITFEFGLNWAGYANAVGPIVGVIISMRIMPRRLERLVNRIVVISILMASPFLKRCRPNGSSPSLLPHAPRLCPRRDQSSPRRLFSQQPPKAKLRFRSALLLGRHVEINQTGAKAARFPRAECNANNHPDHARSYCRLA